MSVRLYRSEDRERWNRYVERSEAASCYHHASWKTVVERSFGCPTYYLLSEDENKNVNGILPLAHVKSRLFGSFLVSLPYFDYVGICTEDTDVYQQLLQEAIRIARGEGAEHIELREARLLDNGLVMRSTKDSMQLQLPSTSEDLWRSLAAKVRSQIRRPEKEGMYARIGREDELDSFHNVFCVNMRDLGTPVHSRLLFKNILAEFPGSTWICCVYKDKEPVAAGFLVGFKERLETPWASSLRRHNRYGPNMLLYWTVLKLACDKGFRFLDFGRSTPGEGTYRFKQQWGAKPVPLYWYYWMRNGGPPPELNPKNPKYRMAINIWKRLPVSLTRLLGPAIIKKLP